MAQIVSVYREVAERTLDPEVVAEFEDYHAEFTALHAATSRALCRAACEFVLGNLLRQNGRYYGSVVAYTYCQQVACMQAMSDMVDGGRYGFMGEDSR